MTVLKSGIKFIKEKRQEHEHFNQIKFVKAKRIVSSNENQEFLIKLTQKNRTLCLKAWMSEFIMAESQKVGLSRGRNASSKTKANKDRIEKIELNF